MTENNDNISIEDILEGDLPEKSAVDAITEGAFVPPAGTTAVERPTEEVEKPVEEVTTKELTGLEKEVKEATEKAESDVRARAAAAPPTLDRAKELIPELRDMPGSEHRAFLVGELSKFKASHRSVECRPVLAVQLYKLRQAADSE